MGFIEIIVLLVIIAAVVKELVTALVVSLTAKISAKLADAEEQFGIPPQLKFVLVNLAVRFSSSQINV